MVGQPESSQPSVNERLARAREEDLRRCRNIQAKLARTQLREGLDQHASDQSFEASAFAIPRDGAQRTQHFPSGLSSSSARAGLMFLSSTEQAQRERDQRSRERQLKRQVAGPIPPESWRDDFDRLSVTRGVGGSHLGRRKLQGLGSSTGENGVRSGAGEDQLMECGRRLRRKHRDVCAGLRHSFDPRDGPDQTGQRLSLRDMALCVIADAVNCPAAFGHSSRKGKERMEIPEMERTQIREVLDYLPGHMRQRMMALCGRLVATNWPLADWTAQALISIGSQEPTRAHSHEVEIEDISDDDDWQSDNLSNQRLGSTTQNGGSETITSLDLSFSTLSTRTLTRMLSTSINGLSLRMLSLAGFNSTSSPSSTSTSIALDSPSMLSIFTQLPNLETLSLAGSYLSSLSSSSSGSGGVDHQRSAVFLRKLSRTLTKLRTLDLSYCRWVSADAIQGVSWATSTNVAWPRLEHLLLVGCEETSDPKEGNVEVDVRGGKFEGKAAGNYIESWHATHSQRDMRSRTTVSNESNAQGGLYDPYTDTTHRGDPFELFNAPAATRSSANRATFGDYVRNTIQPAIVSHMTHGSHSGHAAANTAAESGGGGGEGMLMEYVRCPRSAGKVEMWQWQRVRILEAVRGRTHLNAKQRKWVEVYF